MPLTVLALIYLLVSRGLLQLIGSGEVLQPDFSGGCGCAGNRPGSPAQGMLDRPGLSNLQNAVSAEGGKNAPDDLVLPARVPGASILGGRGLEQLQPLETFSDLRNLIFIRLDEG